MTRLAVLADIHGNLPALQAVIDDMAAFYVDHIIVAGDSINLGPFSTEVLERILDLKWSVIRGNHEFYMLYYNTPYAPEAWRHFHTPRWLNEHIPKPLSNTIAALPDELRLCFPDAPYIRVAHGIPGNHWQGIYPSMADEQIAALLHDIAETTLIVGHTHLPLERHVERYHILNPGSVGMAMDGIPGARYLILDGDPTGWTPTFRHVEYDPAPLFKEWERLDIVEVLGVSGRLIMEDMRCSRPMLFGFNRWREEHYPDMPEALWMVDEYLALSFSERITFFPVDYRINLEAT
jgi:predicted phosphodiesterase